MSALRAPRKPAAAGKGAPNGGLPEVIDGKYRLVRFLGGGSASTVHEAEHLAVGKRVAIKLFDANVGGDDALRGRFLAAARASKELVHPNVCDVYDSGITPEGIAYIVLELQQGETLAQILARRGALPPALACQIMVQVLAGLGAAHRSGVLHAHLSPAKVFVTYPRPDAPLVRLLGFAVNAGVVESPDRDALLGDPVYLSPERVRAGEITPLCDVYAAGAILYQMLTGDAPFSGDRAEVVRKVVGGLWKPVTTVNPAVPRLLGLAVSAAMATDPSRRIVSVKVLAKQLAPYVSQVPPRSGAYGSQGGDAFVLMTGSSVPEIRSMSSSDLPDPSRPPRDFPSLQLANIAGRPRGEPLADSLLQSPIIPRAPTAPKIQISSAIRDVEIWSLAPKATAEQEGNYEASVAPQNQIESWDAQRSNPVPDPGLESFRSPETAEGQAPEQSWQHGAWAAALGAGAGAVLAWLCRFG